MGCHFMPRLALGTGDSEMVKMRPTLISQDLGTDAGENASSNKLPQCEDLKQDFIRGRCGFAESNGQFCGSVKVTGSGRGSGQISRALI